MTLRYDRKFENLDVQIRGKSFPIQVSSLVKKYEDGQSITYRLPFAGQGRHRSVLLVDVNDKCIYYWGKRTITHPGIKMINIRKQPKNCEQNWGTITLMEYLDKNDFFEFRHGQNYSLQNFGIWHAIRKQIRNTCELRHDDMKSQTIREYEAYDHDFGVDRGFRVNCKCQRCQDRGLI